MGWTGCGLGAAVSPGRRLMVIVEIEEDLYAIMVAGVRCDVCLGVWVGGSGGDSRVAADGQVEL